MIGRLVFLLTKPILLFHTFTSPCMQAGFNFVSLVKNQYLAEVICTKRRSLSLLELAGFANASMFVVSLIP